MNNSAEAEKITPKILRFEFEHKGYAAWINSDLYPDGRVYSKEYTESIEKELCSIKNTIASLTDEDIDRMFPGEFMDYADTQGAKRKGAKALRDHLKQNNLKK